MAQRKPRKREYIPPTHEVVNKRERTRPRRPAAGRGKAQATPAQRGGRRAYEPPVPSIRRLIRRLPIYFALIFGIQYFWGPPAEIADDTTRTMASAFSAITVTLAFAPFMYLIERWQYVRWLRRTGQLPPRGDKRDDG